MNCSEKFAPMAAIQWDELLAQIVIMMTVNNCDSQIALHRRGMYSPKWLILCVVMHGMV